MPDEAVAELPLLMTSVLMATSVGATVAPVIPCTLSNSPQSHKQHQTACELTDERTGRSCHNIHAVLTDPDTTRRHQMHRPICNRKQSVSKKGLDISGATAEIACELT